MFQRGYKALEDWTEKVRDFLPSAPSTADFKRLKDLPKFLVGLDELGKASADYCNDDIVVFVGQTKAGKSTLINCLLNLPLLKKLNTTTGDTVIVNLDKAGQDGPIISSESESETAIPQKYRCKLGLDYTLWDMPGFDDNRGAFQEILNAITFKNIITRQKSVLFVLVADFALLRDVNNLPLLKLLSKLAEICPQTLNNVCFVVTRNEKGNVVSRLEEIHSSLVSDKTNEANTYIANEGKKLIGELLFNKAVIDFKQPVLVENSEMEYFEMPNRQQVTDCLNRLNGVKIEHISLVISDAAKCELNVIHSILYDALKEQINKICIFIDNYANSLEKTLECYQKAILKVSDILKINDLTKLVTEVANKLENRDSKGIDSFINAFTSIDELHENIFVSQTFKGRLKFYFKLKKALGDLSAKLSEGIIFIAAHEKAEKDTQEAWVREQAQAREETRAKEEGRVREEARTRGQVHAREEARAREQVHAREEFRAREEAQKSRESVETSAAANSPIPNWFVTAVMFALRWLGWL